MTYINYKKNDLEKISIDEFKLSLPNLSNANKTQTIYVWLSKWIDAKLEEKNISVGNLLPSKAEFAYALGVSLGTIQSVLNQLEDNGYIYSKQCIGSIIKDRNNNDVEIRKQTSKKDIAEESIKNYIKNNSYKIGDKLPASRELANILDIGLNTVRGAITKLISDGVLEYNFKKDLLVKNNKFIVSDLSEETLVTKIKNDLKEYICEEFNIGDKLPPHNQLAKKFNVSIKTIHSVIQILAKEGMLLPRRGSYGTIVISTSQNSAFEPRREMSIFAPAQQTALYHYEKIQQKIENIIIENYDIGSKLPSISEFSQGLDVSPNIIRKALNNLAKDGILRFTRGRYGGTYVINLPQVEEQAFKWLAVNPQYAKVEV